MEAQRPSPEEMLRRAEREEQRAQRGRLKVFLGAVPGVGKTYAMLQDARVRRAQGTDVVVGWIETHGRRETAALAEGMDRIPARHAVHRGIQLLDFDLDAALERRPGLLLLDELAHTNAPGSRHTRRWQDVVELLEAGIDVWTTLNIQHLESLNDVVAGITGVTVRETVPDSLLDGADEIELVDLPPEDLLQRMREGKIYLPRQTLEAGENFFRKGNLIALRELALRRAAERVEAQAAEYRREHGIAETWRTQERLLVAFDHSEHAADLIRAGRRMAAALHGPWIALTVEDPRLARATEAGRERLAELVALAQRLGAETLVVRGDDVAGQVLSVARERGVTRILVGRPRRPRWLRLFAPSRTERIVRGAGGIDVLVTSGEAGGRGRVRPAGPVVQVRARDFAIVALVIGVATAVCAVTTSVFTLADQAMIYLLGVLVLSSRLPRLPSIAGALGSIAALDFFFVEPYYTFAVADLRFVVTFGVMLLVALAVSHRTVLMREHADDALERERRTAALFELSRDLARADSAAAAAAAAVASLRSLLGRDAVVEVRAATGGLRKLAGDEDRRLEDARERGVAEWVLDHGRPAGQGTDTLPAAGAMFLPLPGRGGVLGVLGIMIGEDDAELLPSQRQLLELAAAQTASAIERIQLREEAGRAQVEAEAERTRSTLLSSVSHDLRTPLASISGSAQVLLDDSREVPAAARRELLQTIREESERLGRIVGNLLDLTRIESGGVALQREWCPVDELVESALRSVRDRLAGRDVRRELPSEVLEIECDPVLMEQALANLLENAAKHTPAGAPVDVRVHAEGTSCVLEVADRGPGVAAGEEHLVFQRFFRSGDARGVTGAGLGLAVVQAVARAHGGAATVAAREGGGAVFAIRVHGVRQAAGEART